MTVLRAQGDTIEGERISCQAREIRDLGLGRTGAHRIQRVAIKGNATCIIDRAVEIRGVQKL